MNKFLLIAIAYVLMVVLATMAGLPIEMALVAPLALVAAGFATVVMFKTQSGLMFGLLIVILAVGYLVSQGAIK